VIRTGTRIAIAALSRDPVAELTYDRLAPGGAPRFYGVRPAVDDFRARIDAALAHARAARADITILPELSLTEADHHALAADPVLARLALVVLGSRHTPRADLPVDTPGANLATLIAHGRVVATHAKLSDFLIRDAGMVPLERSLATLVRTRAVDPAIARAAALDLDYFDQAMRS